MDNTPLLSGLNLFTLIAVLVILIGSFMYFLRHRKNRVAASHALGIDDKPGSTPLRDPSRQRDV